MNPTTVAVLSFVAIGAVMFYGFYDSFAEEEDGIIVLLWNLINSTQVEVEEIKTRMAEMEAANTELEQRVNYLERRLTNTTGPGASCQPGYWLNADTNACERIRDDPASCQPGYWLNADTNACERIRDDPASCQPGYWLNADTNACERIRDDPASCQPGYWLNADTNACERIRDDPASCQPGYWLNADTNACERIQDP